MIAQSFVKTWCFLRDEMMLSDKKLLIIGGDVYYLQQEFSNQPRFVFLDINQYKLGRMKKLSDNIGFVAFTMSISHKWKYKIDSISSRDIIVLKRAMNIGIMRQLLAQINLALIA